MRYIATTAVLAIAGAANAAVFTTQAAFLPNLAPGFFFNDFNTVPNGASGPLNFSGNGFAYTVGTQIGAVSGLFNDGGRISTDNATDQIVITFTGAPVTAVGGNFWSTDINFNPIATTVTVNLSNGDSASFNSTSSADFRGFTSAVAIASLSIDAQETPSFAWATLDNLYVGQEIPAPSSLALLGIGALAAARRRR